MSKAGHDGETHGGCAHWDDGANPDEYAWCDHHQKRGGNRESEFSCLRGDPACKNFKPSLQCRHVRALERIADSLSAREPEVEKPREPRKRKTKDCDDCKGQGVTDEGFCPSCGGLGAVLITAAGR
jgi:hypothetical protein